MLANRTAPKNITLIVYVLCCCCYVAIGQPLLKPGPWTVMDKVNLKVLPNSNASITFPCAIGDTIAPIQVAEDGKVEFWLPLSIGPVIRAPNGSGLFVGKVVHLGDLPTHLNGTFYTMYNGGNVAEEQIDMVYGVDDPIFRCKK